MGGGLAIGDVNNDGLQDIYFTANMDENRLYLNQGDLKFSDITEIANVGGDDRWVTGVTMADVNADGWMDIYVSVSGRYGNTKNQLFVNNGIDSTGNVTFVEKAEELGIADEGHSTQGTFFDYDNDGDVDLYVANYPYTSFKTNNFTYRHKINKKAHEDSDRLYRNKGDGTFEDVTAESGILNFGLSLSATVGDFDQNGYEDIYVSNDFASPDFFYFNNGDGTFTEKIRETTRHIPFYGMGADVADFNNDGLLDILQMDMTPSDNKRSKANMGSMNPSRFYEMTSLGLHQQYMQNALQLNNGIDEKGTPHFSDISQLSDMAFTDWSWAGLFADFDNDGWKDIFITNGTRRDINNKDYFYQIDKAKKAKKELDYLELTLNMPSEAIDNFAFKNNGDLSFTNVVEDWGLSFPGYSNGASYGDLDNDGDLDMVVNNIDAPASIFQNMTSDRGEQHFIGVKLVGPEKNTLGLGAKIEIRSANSFQFQQHTLTRGFQSSTDPVIHFGLGEDETIQELKVVWSDTKQQVLVNISVDEIISLNYLDAVFPENEKSEAKRDKLFQDVSTEVDVSYLHTENQFDDFKDQVLLPHIYSRNGPALSAGDVNDDGFEDFYVGGSATNPGILFIQNEDGKFSENIQNCFIEDKGMEDLDALFFDADDDGDLDLYVVSGGSEFRVGSPKLQDRLYINDGKGTYARSGGIPDMQFSGGNVEAGDFDDDGDLDLFVGGRLIPGSYPLPASSFILRNDSDAGEVEFVNVTESIAPKLNEIGLVTDAVWLDYNNDELLDLVVVGEWMPLTVFKNSESGFSDATAELSLENTVGWWYTVLADDFDGDGDLDLVAGNLGLNYKYKSSQEESFDVYVKDYDKNGKLDIVLGYYNNGIQYPVRGKSCSSEQIPAISSKYETYDEFSVASLEDIYTDNDLQASLHYQATTFATSYFENLGGQGFLISKLPNEVQISNVNGMVSDDFNKDGNIDLLLIGNLYGAEVETTRNDASYGSMLAGDGSGGFTAVPFDESGFYVNGDAKDIAAVQSMGSKLIVTVCNDGPIVIHRMN